MANTIAKCALLGCIVAIAGVAIAQMRPEPNVPTRSSNPTDEGKVATVEEPDFTRFRVTTDQGTLVVFDAEEDWDGREEPASQLAYWNDFASEQLFFFDRLLFTSDDVLQSVAAMQRDLDIDPAPILSEMPELDPLLEPDGAGIWRPATEDAVFSVMSGQQPGAVDSGEVSGVDMPCVPSGLCDPAAASSGPIPGPVRGTSSSQLFEMVQSGSNCNCHGGYTPPPPSDPCTPPAPGRCCNSQCSTCQANDCDSDGIPNASDPDVDGDGIPNGSDPDVDGDGIPNRLYCDIDGDGLSDWEDSDADGDGFPNEEDIDADGDGLPYWEDEKRNGCEGPCDNSNIYCCGISDPCSCANVCGSLCGVDCDDGIGCTTDYCVSSSGEAECESSCQIGISDGDGTISSNCNIPFNVEIREITFKATHELHENRPDANGWEVGQNLWGGTGST